MITGLSPNFSRRQFLLVGGVAMAGAYLIPRQLFSQTDDLVDHAIKETIHAKIEVQRLRRNVSVLLGPGGNIAVLTGADGKILIDAEIISARRQVTAALAKINNDPIKQLINTHWHFDHTGGNEWLHEAGASILAHENTRKHLSKETRVEGWKHTFPSFALKDQREAFLRGEVLMDADVRLRTAGAFEGNLALQKAAENAGVPLRIIVIAASPLLEV